MCVCVCAAELPAQHGVEGGLARFSKGAVRAWQGKRSLGRGRVQNRKIAWCLHRLPSRCAGTCELHGAVCWVLNGKRIAPRTLGGAHSARRAFGPVLGHVAVQRAHHRNGHSLGRDASADSAARDASFARQRIAGTQTILGATSEEIERGHPAVAWRGLFLVSKGACGVVDASLLI